MVRFLADSQINVMIHRFHSESICSSDVHCCQQTCQVVCSTLLTDHLTRYHPQTVHTDLRAWNTGLKPFYTHALVRKQPSVI